jgi:hypothetical protein
VSNDAPGRVVDASGRVVDAPGMVVDASGWVVDAPGMVVDDVPELLAVNSGVCAFAVKQHEYARKSKKS